MNPGLVPLSKHLLLAHLYHMRRWPTNLLECQHVQGRKPPESKEWHPEDEKSSWTSKFVGGCLLIFRNQICQCDASQLVLPSKVWIPCPFCWTSRTSKQSFNGHVNHTYLAWFAFRIQFVIPGSHRRMKFHPWKDFLLSFAKREVQHALGPVQQGSLNDHILLWFSVLCVGFWARSRFCRYEEVWTGPTEPSCIYN